MQIAQIDIESLWREAWERAPEGANTFSDELKARWLIAKDATKAGSLISVSHSGSSQSYAASSPDTRTTVYVERMHIEAIRLYEKLAVTFAAESDVELAIYNEGIAIFAQPVDEFQADFSQARSYV